MASEKEVMKFYLFNCDQTYDLKTVEELLVVVEEKYDFKISAEPLYFGLRQMTELADKTLPTLDMDFAIFVLHANESRLSINETNAGIGYAKLYQALLQSTDNKVLLVIGGDTHYKDKNEQENFVMSRWVKMKLSSQFNEEDLDGRKSFIFSWDTKHRLIHEAAMRHFLDPNMNGIKFNYTPPPKPQQSSLEPSLSPQTEPFLPEHEEGDPVEAGSCEFVAGYHDDKEKLMGSKETPEPYRRSFGDRCDGQQRHYTENDGASRSAASGAFFDYPADTVLLETRLQNGKISYEEEDIVQRIDRWQPSDRQVAHLREDYGSTPEATVVFTARGNGAVNYYVTLKSTGDRNGCSSLFRCLARCLRWLGNTTTACLLCVAHHLRRLCGWMMRTVGIR